MAYTHFGARLARPGRFNSCTLYQSFRAGSSTEQNSWPTPNRCGFNSRTAHEAGLARRSSPRSITARCWFDSTSCTVMQCKRVDQDVNRRTILAPQGGRYGYALAF